MFVFAAFVIYLVYFFLFFFFKQKTAYEVFMRDWGSDVALPIWVAMLADSTHPVLLNSLETATMEREDRKSVV